MAITGYQFDMQMVPASKDASLIHALSGETNGVLRRGNEFAVTANGLQATVATGQAIIQGRLVEITSNESVTLPANSSGKICIVVDLTKTNSVVGVPGQSGYNATINQVYVLPVLGTLTQDNLNDGGYIYELPIATFTTTGNSASIMQTNPILNDTGWIDLPKANGVTFNNSEAFSQYRVRDNTVYMRWNQVNVLKSTNGNQIGNIPSPYRPDVTFTAAAIDYGSDGNIYPMVVHVNPTGTLWVDYNASGNHAGAVGGMVVYPI